MASCESNSQAFIHNHALLRKRPCPICSHGSTAAQAAQSTVHDMPLAIFALTIAAYAIGTTEFVIVGLLPTVAQDLDITLPLAGLIVSVYALGVTFGAPVLTALTGRIDRKPLLLGLMALFVVGNTAAALSPSYELLLVARVLSAFAHGVFFSVTHVLCVD
eukprot:Opistho-2@12776